MRQILIVDDHAIVRKGMMSILAEIVPDAAFDEASLGSEALVKTAAKRYDLVIMDISMPGMSGIETIQKMDSRTLPPILVMSVHPEDQYAIRAMRAGARGYLTLKEIAAAVTKLLNGDTYVTAQLGDLLCKELLRSNDTPASPPALSNREFEVARRIVEGRKPKSIAEEMCLSKQTVATYRTRIMQKLHISSNAELALYFTKNNLLG
ncbi:MAG: response regulator transcription factor [Geobacter sp.]|nr:response regulator transcription factor [Geobacter sp.]